MPDDRLFHKKLGHSQKVNLLTDAEEIVWRTYIQAADDFGVMRFSAVPLRAAHERLEKRPEAQVMRMLEHVAEVGLIYTFEHQRRVYCYQRDWQNFQKVRYPLKTSDPRIPSDLLADCTPATRWLHTAWPGGKIKLATWQPTKEWLRANGIRDDDPGSSSSGSALGSPGSFREPSGKVPGDRARARAGAARTPSPTPIPVPEPVRLELEAEGGGQTYEKENLPTLTRRAVLTQEQFSPSPSPHDDRPATCEPAATLRDRAGDPRAGADDQRQRVASAHQGSPLDAGVRDAVGSVGDRAGDESGRAGGRAGVGIRATDGSTGQTATDDGRAPGRSAVEGSVAAGAPGICLAEGDRRGIDQIRQLRATLSVIARGGARC